MSQVRLNPDAAKSSQICLITRPWSMLASPGTFSKQKARGRASRMMRTHSLYNLFRVLQREPAARLNTRTTTLLGALESLIDRPFVHVWPTVAPRRGGTARPTRLAGRRNRACRSEVPPNRITPASDQVRDVQCPI